MSLALLVAAASSSSRNGVCGCAASDDSGRIHNPAGSRSMPLRPRDIDAICFEMSSREPKAAADAGANPTLMAVHDRGSTRRCRRRR